MSDTKSEAYIDYLTKSGEQVARETQAMKNIWAELSEMRPEAQLRTIGFIWDYLALDDFKREKQLTIQKQVKEASK